MEQVPFCSAGYRTKDLRLDSYTIKLPPISLNCQIFPTKSVLYAKLMKVENKQII
jgi:hypothetical protein